MQKLLFIVCSFWLSSTFAQGVSDTEIKLGVSNAQSGPAAALGSGVLEGAKVYLDSLNANGGVNGRKVNLVVYDDAYEPKKTIENTAKLIEQDKVLALVGYVGTPTSKAILPLIGKNKVPYIAPLTGAEFLRNPVNPNVFNIRASYFDETEALVNGMVADLGAKKIGIFVQDDGYGDAGKSGVVRALRKKGLKLAGEGRYTRNTLDVDAGLDVLMKAKPDAIILVGAYKPCAAFIKKAKAKGFAPHFANISFVGTKNLIEELGGAGEGSFISQAIPSP
ncbi:MAG: ABC transporter substrate-binding protein, partial [Bdellovibrionota bacterium]|nr:ABC transporter substrate-binding protein [Bdellovibrionota bacterium]